MNDEDCPYEILGVKSDASAGDIKKNYRKLALKNHPDRQHTEADKKNAQSVFAKIANAYEILSDEEEREQYDLRKKYGGAPGTRYTTTNNPPNNNATRSGGTPGTTRRTSRTAAPTSSAAGPSCSQYSQKDGKFTATVTREDGTTYTFMGSANGFQDPYEVFAKAFQDKTGEELPANMQKPTKQQRSTGATTKSVPVQTTSSTSTPTQSMPVPRTNNVRSGTRTSITQNGNIKTITKTETLPDGRTRTSMEQVPVDSGATTTTKSTKKSTPGVVKKGKTTRWPTSSTSSSSPMQQQQPVGSSMKTRTVQHDNGQVETITETTETMADGTTRTSSSSKLSNASSATTSSGSRPTTGVRRMLMSGGR